MRSTLHRLGVALVLLLVYAGKASADRLDITAITALDDWLAEAAKCQVMAAPQRATCMAALPATPASWDRNKSSSIELLDSQLAWTEYWDEGRLETVCYDARGATRFFEECNLESCLASHVNDADCADNDHDGLLAYQEAQLGTSETRGDTCLSNATCGFKESCTRTTYDHDANAGTAEITFPRPICLTRPECTNGGCTAFHLSEVSEDDTELIVHVYYDYSPEPARALDLRVQVPNSGLTLTDARLLPAATNAGKELETRHITEGSGANLKNYVRLLIYGTSSLVPIAQQPGGTPVAELVFAKTGGVSGSVSFSSLEHHRNSSVAPTAADRREELEDGSLWGSPVAIDSNSAQKLVAHYSFDDAQRPLVKNVLPVTGTDSLCERPGASCGSEQLRTASQEKHLVRLTAIHDGVVDVSEYRADGVVGSAARFAGAGDHLEAPLWLDDQDNDVSWSLWVYPDDGNRGLAKQLLVGQADKDGVLRYGLYLERKDSGTFTLTFEQKSSALVNSVISEVASGLAARTWMHLGLAVSSATNKANVHLRPNGGLGTPKNVEVTMVVDALSCPNTENNLLSGLSLDPNHERLFVGQSEQSLFGISELDVRGTSDRDILRLDTASALDPDYSTITDRIVYISDKSGGYEVWIAYPDGSGAEQITYGFGNTERKIFARRPRWSTDGKTIVFESNTYEVRQGPSESAAALDNVRYGSTRLFAIPYNPEQRKVVVPRTTGSDQTTTILDYGTLTSTQRVNEFVLGRTIREDHHAMGARWLDPTTLAFTESEQLFDHDVVKFMTVTYSNGTYASTVTGSLPAAAEEVTLLDARRGRVNDASPFRTLALVRLGKVSYVQDPAQLEYQLSPVAGAPAGHTDVKVTYVPRAGDHCYDQNFNLRPDLSLEDLNGDGSVTVADCYAREVSDLYVAYTSPLTPLLTNGKVLSLVTPPGRVVQLTDVTMHDASRAIKVEVTLPGAGTDPGPLSSGLEIARIRFTGTGGNTRLVVRQVDTELVQYERDANGSWLPRTITLPVVDGLRFGQTLAAAYAPNAARVALSVVLNARPVLVTAPTTGTTSVQRLLTLPQRLEGLDWENMERFRPCQWVGARRAPSGDQAGEVIEGFRGLLDEVKIYNYARAAQAFASEAERGGEWLKKRGANGQGSSLFACTRATDCASYEVCQQNQCVVQPCSAAQPCQEGQCTLQPVPVADLRQSGVGEEYVRICSVECSGDSQCFQRDCYAGPCRFCAQGSCIECRTEADQEVAPGIVRDVMAGCPDESRFSCEEGSCVSECYSFDNGQSRYLCSANEYCHHGKCVAKTWDWPDFAPATFAGGADAYYDIPAVNDLQDTIVKSYRHTVELVAYGHTDYGAAPELLVEAIATPSPYGTNWFVLGRVQVHQRTHANANSDLNKIRLHSSYPLKELRISLVAGPHENPFRGAVGYGSYDSQVGRNLSPAATYRLGHPLVRPYVDLLKAYDEEPRDRYLLAGDSTVIVSQIYLNGQPVMGILGTSPATVENKLCPYTTAAMPPPKGTPINFNGARVALDTSKTFAVLNCVSSTNPTRWTGLLVKSLPDYAPQQGHYAQIRESGGGCFFEKPRPPGSTGPAIYEPCYEFTTGTVSFDPYASLPIGYGSIEIRNAGSFGYTTTP